MWDQLQAVNGWTAAQVPAAQAKVVGRGHALIGTAYDWPAYVAFSLEVLHLRNGEQLAECLPARQLPGVLGAGRRRSDVRRSAAGFRA